MCASEHKSEVRWLALAEEFQGYLKAAIDSLGGKPSEGVHEGFKFYSATHIKDAIAGYVLLRKSGLRKASVLLIRPALESLLRLVAVHEKPELICRIAHEEYKEEKKLLASFSAHHADISALNSHWAEFKSAYTAKYTKHPFSEVKLTLKDVAESAKLGVIYDLHYRVYCKYTHGTLRATIGGFDGVDMRDSRTMTICALISIEVIRTFGATAPDKSILDQMFKAADKEDSKIE